MPKLRRNESEERATDFVESLDRGLRLLQCFGTTAGPMTLSDLARAAELPRATARRMLFTLQRGGFVSGDGKLFSLTPHVLTLAASYLRSNQLVAVLQPVLDRIATADRTQGYSLVDREAEPHFRSISVPVRRYDNVIVAAINMGAHVDRVPEQELIDRFLPLLQEGATSLRSQLL